MTSSEERIGTHWRKETSGQVVASHGSILPLRGAKCKMSFAVVRDMLRASVGVATAEVSVVDGSHRPIHQWSWKWSSVSSVIEAFEKGPLHKRLCGTRMEGLRGESLSRDARE